MTRNRLSKLCCLTAAALATLSVVGSADASSEYRVRARIRSAATEGKGEYRERLVGNTLIQKWTVELNRAAPKTSYEVRLNGSPIGMIVTNGLGTANQEFRTTVVDDNPHDEEPPIPTDFPHINVGDTLTIVGVGTAGFARR